MIYDNTMIFPKGACKTDYAETDPSFCNKTLKEIRKEKQNIDGSYQ